MALLDMSDNELADLGFTPNDEVREKITEALDTINVVENIYKRNLAQFGKLDEGYGTDYTGFITHQEISLRSDIRHFQKLRKNYKEMLDGLQAGRPHNKFMSTWLASVKNVFSTASELREKIQRLAYDLRLGTLSEESLDTIQKYADTPDVTLKDAHDLSTVVRNTQAPGTLVPNLTLLVQKGDIIDIDIEANVLTHPTVGPLFGSFKLEHHVYTIPFRLYNSWLHNNRTKMNEVLKHQQTAIDKNYLVFGTYLQGSQNYKLDLPTSDIDTKTIVIPSFIVTGKQIGRAHV